jgi:hypothetical protein
MLADNPGSALLHGEPGCGKSTLALKFAWVGQSAFAFLTDNKRASCRREHFPKP